MFITHLSLTNFRNYRRLELDIPPHVVVLQGSNAQGKTNLLEAFYLLATTRSPRATAERELINWANEEELPVARLCAEFQKASGEVQIEITLRGQPGEVTEGLASVQKRIRVNGIVRRAIDLIGQVNVVMFSAHDIDLIGGSPALRRRYLDITNSQVDSRYLRSLQRYNKVLLRRNHLLRLIQDHRAAPDELSFWDSEMVEAGSYLIAQRQEMVAALNDLTKAIHFRLTGDQERLEMVYVGSVGKGDLLQLQDALRDALGAAKEKEIAQGMSLVGPHRDDLRFMINGVDIGVYGSRGQQRTVALSLRLAEAKFMLEKSGETPILLLDDVLSELDEMRRRHLLGSTASYQQVIITTTDLDRFEPEFLAQAAKFRVQQGRIEPLKDYCFL